MPSHCDRETTRASGPSPVDEPSFRAICYECWRPSVVCLCHAVRPQTTRTRVVILQHPRERDVPINTARLAHLSLPSSELHVGLVFEQLGSRFQSGDAGEPAPLLLYPGEPGDEMIQSVDGGRTLLVLDGTWSQAQQVYKRNPWLHGLPRLSIAPAQPSRYTLRKEPEAHCLSTIEAIAEALLQLEEPPFDPELLLSPFLALVEQQEDFAARFSAARHHNRVRAARTNPIPELLQRELDGVVAVYGEANAWPRGTALGPFPELVHFAAERLGSGERLEVMVKPRRELSPSFSTYARVPAALVEQGEPVSELRQRWERFCCPGDRFVTWGHFAVQLAADEGLTFDPTLDLRELTRQLLRGPVGEVEACAERIGCESPEIWAVGRTGQRLAALAAIARQLAAQSAHWDAAMRGGDRGQDGLQLLMKRVEPSPPQL